MTSIPVIVLLKLFFSVGIANGNPSAVDKSHAVLFDMKLAGVKSTPMLTTNNIATYGSEGLKITGTDDVVRVNKFYAIAERMVQYTARFSSDAVAIFRSSEGDFNAFVDVANKKISVATHPLKEIRVDFLRGDRDYLVEVYHIYQQSKIRIVDLKSGKSSELVAVHDGQGGVGKGSLQTGYSVGMQWDHYCFGLKSGTSMLVKRITVKALKNNVKLLLYGDSITQPEGYFPTKDFPMSWTQQVIKSLDGNAMSSGRGGATIDMVLEYIKNELPYIRSQYVMVTIGTNGGNTEEKLKELVAYIRSQNSIPILNNIPANESGTQVKENALIAKVRADEGIDGSRFDLATSLAGDGKEVDKSTMYWEDYTGSYGWQVYHHPNEIGGSKMFEQLRSDVPEIFKQRSEPRAIHHQAVSNGDIYVITQHDANYKFDSARYSIFIPKDVDVIEGIFIHQHGCTMEGRGVSSAYDLQYQAFAKKWNLAIIGPDLYDAKNNCHDWKDAESGTADALLKTIKQVGDFSKHKELYDASWLLWGHSGGGYWAQSMMTKYPERIMAVFSYSPGLDTKFTYPQAALQIPIMIRYAGVAGDACCWQSAESTFASLRSAGGNAAITLTPHQNHNFSYVRYLAIPFFESIMSQRMPKGSSKGYKSMLQVDPSRAWLGDTSSLNIYRASEYPGNKLSAAWLPDSSIAVKWREYSITGTIVDRTAPPAPYAVKMERRHNVTVSLAWSAEADIESGISHFNIYKGDQLVGRFPAVGSYQNFDTNGDDAYPLVPQPMQTDVTLWWNDSSTLSISAVNHFGLESPRVRP